MPIKMQTDGIGEVFVGTESIGEVYAGTELVWQKAAAAGYTFNGTGTAGLYTWVQGILGNAFFNNSGVAANATNTINMEAPDQTYPGADTLLPINTATVSSGGNSIIMSNLTGVIGMRQVYNANLVDLGDVAFTFDTPANAAAGITSMNTALGGSGFAFGNATIIIT